MKLHIPLHTYQGQPWCGGIIIGSKTILTAAHCVGHLPSLRYMFIDAGITKSSITIKEGMEHRQRAYIESYTVHPDFSTCKFF